MNFRNARTACFSMKRPSIPLLFLILILIFVLPGGIGQAQVFGKNKVQYKNFKWSYIQTRHFDIYFSEQGEDIAEFTAFAAESALVRIQQEIRYDITNRIPIILYNSHNDFQQTNAVDMYMEEGIGGVTALLKNRVIRPFEGSYRLFRHVIHHELVHAVLNDMFYGGSIQSIIANNIRLQLPIWLNEGLAEYLSLGGWDTNSDMFLRDATVGNYLPPIQYLDGYFAYRGGQSLWWYIAEKYGKEKVGEILNHIRSTRSVPGGFRAALGLDLDELSERWQKEQKVLYWPDIAKRKSPQDYAKRLTNHRKGGNFYNTSPAISPSGDKIAFISDRSGFFSVYLMSATDGSDVKELVEGQQTNDFEELHLLTPGLTWSPDGRKIALAVKAGASDAVFLIDAESGARERLPIEMDGIFSVEWSPDGNRIAFVGNNARQSDIFVYDIGAKQLTNLTDDMFTDAQPAWAPDGRTIYFSSDRDGNMDPSRYPEEGARMAHRNFSQMDIYAVDVETRALAQITRTPLADESYPVISEDGKKMLFISDRNGINNIYIHEFATGKEYPITNSISGVYQLSLTRDGSKLAFASMDEAGFDIFLLKSPFEKADIGTLEPTEFVKRRTQEMAEAQSPRSSAPAAADSTRRIGMAGDVVVDLNPPVPPPQAGAVRRERITFGREREEKKTPDVFALRDNVDSAGNFRVNKYRISFTPDLIYGNAGFNTFYGVLGTAQMAFSDLLGDHQIYFLSSFLEDLKNSDFALSYLYLPDRIDWGFQGYHMARFLYGSTGYLYRFRNYGGGIIATLPFDKYYRMDFGLTWMNISRENLTIEEPMQQNMLFVPRLSYVHDNSQWGVFAPDKGVRFDITAYGSPGLGTNSFTFSTLTFDYRRYYSLASDVSVGLRASGGGSFGGTPQRFFIGGTENWINRTFENNYIPVENANDFAFLTPGLPLRGYNYNARIGTRYALLNGEFRFPLVKYFLGGVLPFLLQTINSVIFVDAGMAWDDFKAVRFFEKNDSGKTVTGDLLLGTGFGFRMFFLGFPFKLDFGWPFDGQNFGSPKFYISLGGDY